MYGSQKAVDDIYFSLQPNQITGFLGPNGAGKSTTMKMITGFLQQDYGEITVCGIPVATNETATKKKIGYLPESNPLYLEMYVREYLTFLSNVHQIHDASKRIEQVITEVGLQPESHKKISQLSKGYKQRVGLASALLHDPEILILDEPTTGLDPNQILEIREVIKQLGTKKTILFSSHIMQEVQAICDRVIIINKGKIIADDTLSNLRNNMTDKQSLTVKFKENVNKELLMALPHSLTVDELPANQFVLTTDSLELLKKEIMALSLEKQLDITALSSENKNLENIFTSLTKTN
jgi:ABC-2 type transport system ATP-binding protein